MASVMEGALCLTEIALLFGPVSSTSSQELLPPSSWVISCKIWEAINYPLPNEQYTAHPRRTTHMRGVLKFARMYRQRPSGPARPPLLSFFPPTHRKHLEYRRIAHRTLTPNEQASAVFPLDPPASSPAVPKPLLRLGRRQRAALDQDLLKIVPWREAHNHKVDDRDHELERADRQDRVGHRPV